LSRREFARGATVAAAAIAANPGGVLGAAGALAASGGVAVPAVAQEPAGEKPKLSAEALAEVEAKVAAILGRYGAKLSEEQKADVRRLLREVQPQLEALRAFPLGNSDEPATILHLVGRSASRTPDTPPAAKKPAGTGA
jgi:hypothetical protein